MTSNNQTRYVRICRYALIFVLWGIFHAVHAAALGELQLLSRLGEPLRAEIRIEAMTAEERNTLSVTLAPVEDFKRANIPFDPVLSTLNLSVAERNGVYYVTLNSAQAVDTLAMNMLLELRSGASRLTREYTLLLDPPESIETSVRLAGVPIDAAASPDVLVVTQQHVGLKQDKLAYTIREDDFLGKIASRFKADDISVYQMMVAIFNSNPLAFVGNNINRMRVGSVLTIPDEVTVRNINQSDARFLVIQQGKAYRSGVLNAPATEDEWQLYPQ
jgi:pilus assembly protein FimV